MSFRKKKAVVKDNADAGKENKEMNTATPA